jgi:hypothetical protein
MSDNSIALPNFEEMEIGKLRQYAAHLHVAIQKTATKADIIAAISSKIRDKSVAVIADQGSSVPPGHAKIIVLEDPMPGAANYPIFLNANGYVCTIPRGKEVIVPMRVVRTLQNAMVNRRKQSLITDEYGREKFVESTVLVPSYPFNVIDMTPGPEPLTALEKSKEKTIGPRRRYQAMFGHWPKPLELTRAIEQGLITLDNGEDIADSERRAMAELAK